MKAVLRVFVVSACMAITHAASAQALNPGPEAAAPSEVRAAPQAGSSPASLPLGSRPPRPVPRGWALPGGILGLAGVVPVSALGFFSAASHEQQGTAIASGAGATALFGALVPVTFLSSRSVTRRSDVHGVTGLRVTGFIAYGLSIIDAFALLTLGMGQVDPGPGPIVAATLLGDAALTMFAIDALVVNRRAKRMRAEEERVSKLQLAPVASARSGGALVGFGGRF